MSSFRRLFLVVVCLFPASAFAFDLQLPNAARLLIEDRAPADTARLAIGPYHDNTLPTVATEGEMLRQAFSQQSNATTLQLLKPLRDQITGQGYKVLYECADTECGGFDFRFGIDVFPAPYMYVNLFDYRYLIGRSDTDAGPHYITLLVSRSASSAFIQIEQVAPDTASLAGIKTSGPALPVPEPRPLAQESQPSATATPPLSLEERLETTGHTILRDLAFETGSSALGAGPFQSLAALAAYLQADPARRIVLVGHTDSVGALEGNIALSKLRAASVLERLATAYTIPRNQLSAEGMGYLSPIATNRTEEGRDQNRRVEAVLLNTQ